MSIGDLKRMEQLALPLGKSAADQQEDQARAERAAARLAELNRKVAHDRARAEYTARRLLKARARQGDFAVPAGATALDLIDLIDELAKDPGKLHLTIKPGDMAALRRWHSTKRLMFDPAERGD